jgi:hypothetical protein
MGCCDSKEDETPLLDAGTDYDQPKRTRDDSGNHSHNMTPSSYIPRLLVHHHSPLVSNRNTYTISA